MAVETRIQKTPGLRPQVPNYFRTSREWTFPHSVQQRSAFIREMALRIEQGDNTAAMTVVKHVIASDFHPEIMALARTAFADIKPVGDSFQQFGFPLRVRVFAVEHAHNKKKFPAFYLGPLLELLPVKIGTALFSGACLRTHWTSDIIKGARILLGFSAPPAAARFMRDLNGEDCIQLGTLLQYLRSRHSQMQRYQFGRYRAAELMQAWSQS
jgi:hypothetical protein